MAKQENISPAKPASPIKCVFDRIGFDWIRVVLGILILSVLLGVSLNMINDQFAEVQDKLIEKKMNHFGWIAIVIGYTVPLILACSVPVVMCLGSKKDAQRKHLIKALIVLGAFIIVILIVCPKEITDLVEQREMCLALEEMEETVEDFVYPETQLSVKEVTLLLQRAVEWTAKAGLGLAIVGAYQGVRYKKLRDGDADEEVPEDELADDLPDVDWTPGKRETKNS